MHEWRAIIARAAQSGGAGDRLVRGGWGPSSYCFLLYLFVCLFCFPSYLSLHQAGDDLGDAKPLGGVAHLGSPLSLPFPPCYRVCLVFSFSFLSLFLSLGGG